MTHHQTVLQLNKLQVERSYRSTSDDILLLVDSIEEHFARSLAKFRLLNQDELTSIHRQKTESIVDDHFAKALGTTTWEKFKDKF